MTTNDPGVITDAKLQQTLGVSRPGGVAQINSIHTKRIAGDSIYCSGDAYINGGIQTQLRLMAGSTIMDGTSTAPALAFTSEPTTGLFRPGPGSIGVSVLGSKVLTATPSSLQVPGSITTATGSLKLCPAGQYIDCSGRTLINVAGLIFTDGSSSGPITNPNLYTVTAPGTVTTTNNTAVSLYNVTTSANACYVLNSALTCTNSTDGVSAA